jgi:hypothetical protein
MQPTYFDINTNIARTYESTTTKIAFEREPKRVKLADANEPPATILARRASGELVVSRAELSAMMLDEPELRIERAELLPANFVAYQRGLAHESNASSNPELPTIPPATREIVVIDRGRPLGETLDEAARFQIESEMQAWEAERNLRAPQLAPQRAQLRGFAISGVINNTARWIRHGLSDPDELPMRALDSVFGPAPWVGATLPPVFARTWATNESLPAALAKLISYLGIPTPPPWMDTTLAEREHAIQANRSALDGARFAEEDRARIQGEADDLLERTLAELGERNNAAARAWVDAVDRCRRRAIASVDRAIVIAPSTMRAIVRLALFELAHHLRELPSLTGMDPELALTLAIAGGGLVRVRDSDVPELPTKSIRLSVSTRHPIKRRRRAGFDFVATPQEIEVDEGQAALIEKDDGLVARRVLPGQSEAELRALQKQTNNLDALRAENERLRAEHAAHAAKQRDEKLAALEKAFAEALADPNRKQRETRLAELQPELEKVKAELLASVAATTKPTGQEP